ncbi:MAG: DUF1801 domain-containing protein [Granulosicoccus sp.]|nr:DUF1801 domain-containing protein [Granulosicoccus sp.]
MNEQVEAWFKGLTPAQQSLLSELRQLIFDAAPDAVEELKWNQPCYRRNGFFCYLQKAARHVTIGFQQGAQLSDPESLLQGEGKGMRHIKIRIGERIRAPAIQRLIAQALALDEV